MSKKVPLYAVILVTALAAVITFNASFLYFNDKYNTKLNETLSSYSYFNKLLGIDSVVRAYYIGEIDDKELEAAIIRGYLSGIGDKYTDYMTSEEYNTYLAEQDGNEVGIGVYTIYDAASNAAEVISVLPDSPADEAGVEAGDMILEIDGKSISDVGYNATLDLLKGEEGTTVSFTVMRGSQKLAKSCVRKTLKTFTVTYHIFGGSGDVGVIRISEFNGTTPDQLKTAVESLKATGCRKFVFDLRYNPGGEMSSIIKVLDYLLPEGPLAHVFYTTGQEEHYTSDASFLDAPIAVLTNGRTASAAELFTCALKDYTEKGMYNAVIVGEKTYGKGVLQRYFALKDNSVFKISIGKYNPPYSENYDGVGIIPDIEVKLSDESAAIHFYKLTDKNDDQLIRAVEELRK